MRLSLIILAFLFFAITASVTIPLQRHAVPLVYAGEPARDSKMILSCIGLIPLTASCIDETLDPIEAIVYDLDGDNTYDSEELVLVGPTLPLGTELKDDPKIRYRDSTTTGTTWNSGESIFYDGDGTPAGRVFLLGTPTAATTNIQDDPAIKFADSNGNGVLNGVIKVTVRLERLGGTQIDGTAEDVDAIQTVYTYDPSILSVMRISYPDGSPVLGTNYKSTVRNHCISSGGSPLDTTSVDEVTGRISSNHACIQGPPRDPDVGLGCAPAISGSGCLGNQATGGPLQDVDVFNVQFMIVGYGAFSIDHVTEAPGTPGSKIVDVDGTENRQIIVSLSSIARFANVPFNDPPVASFTFTPTGPVKGSPVQFDASTSQDLDGRIVEYIWEFGDGPALVRETDPYVEHAYALAGGPFEVTLTVVDDDNATATVSATLFISRVNFPPIANFTFTPADPRAGEAVTFDAAPSHDPDGNITRYFWDFGDQGTGEGPGISHTYVSSGNFTVTLTVRDNGGLEGSISAIVNVLPGPLGSSPVANFTFTPRSPVVAESVRFDGSSSFDPDGSIVSWSWNFGDGSSGLATFAYHTYANPGDYNVTLTVRDNRGATDTLTMTVHVRARPTHDVSVEYIDAYPRTAISSAYVEIVVVVRNPGLSNETVDVSVFYDGQVIETATGMELRGFENYPDYRYIRISWDTFGLAPGNYTISATVFLPADENPDDNTLVDGTVTILPPPVLTVTPNSGPLGTTVRIEGSGFSRPSYGPFSFVTITFDDTFLGYGAAEDGEFSFTFNLQHADPGTHEIKAFELYTGVRASAPFQVLPETRKALLEVVIEAGALYFPGDTVDVYVVVGREGRPASLQLELVLIRPDGSRVTLSTIPAEEGLYKAAYRVPPEGSEGTYAFLAKAQDADGSEGFALESFEVKPPWITAQGPRIASISAVAGVAVAVAFVWRKALQQKKRTDTSLSF